MARVLIIEDDADQRLALRISLAGVGHIVDEAANGEEGLRAFKAKPPDLVICDIFMAEMDGLEIIRQIGKESPRVKIVAISGGAVGFGLDPLPAAEKLGADWVIYKPFAISMLLAVVAGLLLKE